MISAVNGDLWLDNIGCFRYRVKLNNPLMGTETLATPVPRTPFSLAIG